MSHFRRVGYLMVPAVDPYILRDQLKGCRVDAELGQVIHKEVPGAGASQARCYEVLDPLLLHRQIAAGGLGLRMDYIRVTRELMREKAVLPVPQVNFLIDQKQLQVGEHIFFVEVRSVLVLRVTNTGREIIKELCTFSTDMSETTPRYAWFAVPEDRAAKTPWIA